MLPFFPLRRPFLSPSHTRSFIDARIKWIRDRALDHAVEKEKHLKPFLALKDLLLLSSPNPSSPPPLPLSSISAAASSLSLPFRPIRFLRLFPSAFVERLPSPPSPPHPVISPSPSLVRLHNAELDAVSSSLPDLADRLLRLLMLSPSRRLPLRLIHLLRFDLGLPRDFPRSLLPNYPDYFHLSDSLDLELVCYRKDLAVSAMERYAARTGGYKKGSPLSFSLHFSRGFDLEKKVRKWVEEWQRLPYISPYEDASHLAPKSDLAEKWTVAVLHEVLSLTVGKKMEKEILVSIGEHLGLLPGLRKVIAHHPGIFYVSNKLRTHTVVLREAYRRDLLVEKHPIMGVRYQYIHLMHLAKEIGAKSKGRKSRRGMKPGDDAIGFEDSKNDEYDNDDDDDEEEDDDDDDEAYGMDSEDEESDDEDEDEGDSSPMQNRKSRKISSSI
ncbi:protein WHAT'S THIS FACTOR 9, mitochondrial-like [Typha latifolia]|uniref:protein WHAT'S THIS FACTOR 9, mitochondrial-like n=1 Tax=Typha latifolia TaxID=4733 RepID=UPI003C300772